MGVKMTGFDNLNKLLDQMQKAAKKFENGVNVSFKELFNESFMMKNTNYSNFKDFLDAGNFNVETQEDFDNLPKNDLDQHVSKTTNFSDWEEMLGTAGNDYVAKEMGL
ncbi:MAG: hypothetical protein K0S34_106 [Bacillales bacterium]|jgi:hypothetical protein|nr:hypothetical protein [Bacillales bacterium]